MSQTLDSSQKPTVKKLSKNQSLLEQQNIPDHYVTNLTDKKYRIHQIIHTNLNSGEKSTGSSLSDLRKPMQSKISNNSKIKINTIIERTPDGLLKNIESAKNNLQNLKQASKYNRDNDLLPNNLDSQSNSVRDVVKSTDDLFILNHFHNTIATNDNSLNKRHGKQSFRKYCGYSCCRLWSPFCIVFSVIGVILVLAALAAIIIAQTRTTAEAIITTTDTTTSSSSLSRTMTSTTSSTTQTSTSSTTTTTTGVVKSPSFWPFDNTTLDNKSIYHGVSINSSTYYTPGIDGYGSALSFNRTGNEYVNVATYRNLSYTSFTVEMWFLWTGNTSADYGLFGQRQTATTDKSLHLQIRGYVLLFAFFADDLMSLTTIKSNVWYHVAFVYDYLSSTQIIYLNGKLDRSRTSNPYQGTSGSIVIGKTEQILGIPNYFSGYIDQVSLEIRTKNASEILDDATLVTWNSFDNVNYTDSGPLSLSITTSNLTSISGKINRAINFTSNSSYYQIFGFVLLGISNSSYSISLWVLPSSTNGSTLVHLSTTKNGQGWCKDLIGFSSTGQIIITGWGNSNQQIIGPILPTNNWTHIVDTYSTTNGHRLYVNGTLTGTTASIAYIASGQVNIITLGNPLEGIQTSIGGTCSSQSIIPNLYLGAIDEFRVYSRELNSTDIFILANP